MRTTIELVVELYRRVRALASMAGRSSRALVEEYQRRVLEAPEGKLKPPALADLMEEARGLVDSGIPDLASNPVHLAEFGRA